MTVAELCLILGALFAFATLVPKIIEVSPRQQGARASLACKPGPKRFQPQPPQRPGLRRKKHFRYRE